MPESKDIGLIVVVDNILFEYIRGHTIIYRSRPRGGLEWTKEIDDILEIREGRLPEKEALELCKKYNTG